MVAVDDVARPVNRDPNHSVRTDTAWWTSYLLFLLLALAVAGLGWTSTGPAFAATFTGLALAILAVLRWPVVGIYLIVFFALLGDWYLAPGYPFIKNLSSQESAFFVSNSLYFSPLELLLLVTLAGWLLRSMANRRFQFHRGTLLTPVVVFTVFVLFGLVYGIGTGGDKYIAVWESRPLLYLPFIYVLVTNLFTTKRHYDQLYWLIGLAITIDSFIALDYYSGLSLSEKKALESLGEHPSSLHANVLLVLLGAVWIFKKGSWARRLILPVLAVPIVYSYFLAQRRSAIAAILVAAVMLAGILFRVNRKAFWRIAPIASLLFLGYLGAFWNSDSSLAFPAEAVKGIVAPEQLDTRDQGSNFYRVLENANILATIQSKDVTGIGFGHKFLRPYPLPNISQFILGDYITHNSLLWVWMKTGVLGFIALLYLVGASISRGVRSVIRLPPDDTAALTLTSVTYVAMYIAFSYVDIAWDAQSLLLFGTALAMIGSIDRLQEESVRESLGQAASGAADRNVAPTRAPRRSAMTRNSAS